MSSLKRSFPSDDIDDDDDNTDVLRQTLYNTQTVPGHHNKRRRCSTLENGFAGLRLTSHGDASVPLSIEEIPAPTSISTPAPFPNARTPSYLSALTPSPPATPMETDVAFESPLSLPSTIVQTGHVEEPTSPDGLFIPEIKMHSSSWYEPEKDRIVITDLDASSDEEEDDTPPATTNVNISPAVLDHLKSAESMILRPPMPRTAPTSADNMALVLFKPIDLSGGLGTKTDEGSVVGDDSPSSASSSRMDEDVDAMDIEL